ncbi:MAG: pilus assembly protein [Gammaproteobacteria bacterium]
MLGTVKRLSCLLMALCAGLVAGTGAFADDTEIYIGLDPSQTVAKPNVLFILDTSGSMGTNVTTTTPFDPAQTYAGDCASNKIFWSTDGRPPACNTGQWFDASKSRCQAGAGALGSGGAGFYTDRLARWVAGGTRAWRQLSTSTTSPPHVECQGDQGVHGDGTGGTYIVNGASGPWQSGSGGAASWTSTGNTYTIFSANYLNWFHYHSTTIIGTRLQIMKDVVKSVVDSNTNINIGLMRYDTRIYSTPPSGNKGGPVIFPMSNIDAPGVRGNFKSQVDGLTASGWTPLSETLYEAYRYVAGQGVVYGKAPNTIVSVSGCLDPSDSTKYKSPMDFECQKNFIVYLTDGLPTYDGDADSAIGSLLSGTTLPSGDRTCAHGTSENPQDNCLDELAEYLHEKDLRSDLNGKQNAVTYTIGFTLDFPLLSQAATKGGGRYFTANTSQELSSAFTQIVTEIRRISDTFTAPAVSVNAFNRLFHRDELYFAVFRPDADIRWPGNLKRYKIGVRDGEFAILDKNNNPAIDANTGFFSDSSTSIWTDAAEDVPDGGAPEKGGAAGELRTPATRNLYTYTGDYTDSSVKVLSDAVNHLNDSNTNLTSAMLGSPANRTELIQWARGVDVDDEDADGDSTEARRDMGDPLHGNPVLVTYGGTEVAPDITVYVTTNDGYLHAIDAGNNSDGSTEPNRGGEIFAFVPQEMLGRLKDLQDDPPIPGAGRDYGLDGPMTAWVKENPDDTDAEIEPAEGDHVYLYFGQRRGGNNYYALDVTDRTAPRLMWRIQGGVAGDFAELSETWSGPKRTRVQLGATEATQRDVLIFGGGFDPDQETSTVPGPDSQGRAIYMVDALTGQRLWWAGYDDPASVSAPDLAFDDMTNSIPANVRVIDLDRNGLADRMYAADLGGRLWRFDINNGPDHGPAVGEPLVSGTLMAEFQKATATDVPGTEAVNRRFFNEPDAALISPPGKPSFMSVSIGSGNRSHPLNKVTQDRFYMVRDPNPLFKPVNASGGDAYPAQWPLQEDDMYDVTNVIDFNDTQQAALDGGPGWMIHLSDAGSAFVGEKALTEAVTFNGVVLFATFTPVATASTNACSPSQGTGRVYAVNVLNGNPVFNLDQAGDPNDLTRTDRSLNLVRTGLPPDIVILFPEPDPNNPGSGGPVALAGPEVLNELDLKNPIVKTYWYADDDM